MGRIASLDSKRWGKSSSPSGAEGETAHALKKETRGHIKNIERPLPV